jgi:hypothetical protein
VAAGAAAAVTNDEPGVDQAAQCPRRGVLADAEVGGDAPDLGVSHQVPVGVGLSVEGELAEHRPGVVHTAPARSGEEETLASVCSLAHGSASLSSGAAGLNLEEPEQSRPRDAPAAAQAHHGQALSAVAVQVPPGQGVGRTSPDAQHLGRLLDGEHLGKLVERGRRADQAELSAGHHGRKLRRCHPFVNGYILMLWTH